MKVSLAPIFGAPGSHILGVVAEGMKNNNLQPSLHSM
jgi:hypothetical protein